jgi:hypothetical protein
MPLPGAAGASAEYVDSIPARTPRHLRVPLDGPSSSADSFSSCPAVCKLERNHPVLPQSLLSALSSPGRSHRDKAPGEHPFARASGSPSRDAPWKTCQRTLPDLLQRPKALSEPIGGTKQAQCRTLGADGVVSLCPRHVGHRDVLHAAIPFNSQLFVRTVGSLPAEAVRLPELKQQSFLALARNEGRPPIATRPRACCRCSVEPRFSVLSLTSTRLANNRDIKLAMQGL